MACVRNVQGAEARCNWWICDSCSEIQGCRPAKSYEKDEINPLRYRVSSASSAPKPKMRSFKWGFGQQQSTMSQQDDPKIEIGKIMMGQYDARDATEKQLG